MIVKINDSQYLLKDKYKKNKDFEHTFNLIKRNLIQLTIEKDDEFIKIEGYLLIYSYFNDEFKKLEIVIDEEFNIIRTNPEKFSSEIMALIYYINSNNFKLGYNKIPKEEIGNMTIKEYYRIREQIESSKLTLDDMLMEYNKQEFFFTKSDLVRLTPEFLKDDIIKFKIGNDKMYMIKDISKNLLNPYMLNEVVTFSKNFSVVMEANNFDEFSNNQIHFLYKHRDAIRGQTFELLGRNIDDFFDVYNFEDSPINFVKGNDLPVLKIEKKSNNVFSIIREFKSKARKILTKKRLYMLKAEKGITYIDLLPFEVNILSRVGDQIRVDKKYLIEFLEFIKNKVENIKIEIKDKALKDEIEGENLAITKPDIYCDLDDEDNILVKIKSDDKEALNNKQMLNLFELSQIEPLRTIKYNDNIMISKNSEKDKFFEMLLPNLPKFANVYLSELIKNINRPRKFSFSVGVKLKSNLLELSFNSSELDKNEMIEILKTFKKGKKYFKLKNGERIVIDNIQFKEIEDMFNDLGLEKLNDLDDKKIKIPKFRIYQLENSENEHLVLAKEKEIDNIFNKKPLEIDKRLKGKLRNYQIEGVNWLLKLRSMELCGILADDMGLGKSLQVISYLESSKFEKPCLIVVPASLLYNWENEFKKFDSNLEILLISGSSMNRENQIKMIKDKKVVVTTYDYLKRDIEKYEKINFDTIIIDEAQNIKNFKTQNSDAVKSIKADYKIALTGTPIENTLAEIWSIFDFLMPNYLYSYRHFSKNYEIPIIKYNDERVKERLKKMVEPFILRRLKVNVLNDLPEKIEEEFYVKMNEEETKIYKAFALEAKNQLSDLKQSDKLQILAMLTKLRQICIDPRLISNNSYKPSSKIMASMELIKKAIKNNQKVLLFSSFTSVLDLIADECEKENIKFYQIIGSTSKDKRIEYVEEFQKDKTPLFLISLKAGGTGLNLTSAEVVIHIDPWWNISAQNQATDRAYRIGQKNKVQVFNMIVKDSIEEKILKLQKSKKELSDVFVENSEGSFAKMSKNDILDLFKID